MSRSERSRRAATVTTARREDLWTDGEDRTLIAMWSSGSSAREIAPVVGRPRGSVDARVHALRDRGVLARLPPGERKVRERRARASITSEKLVEARLLVAENERLESFGYVVGLLYGDAFVHTSRMSIALKCTNRSFADSFAVALQSSLGGPVKTLERVEPIKRIGTHEYRHVTYYEVYLHRRHITAALVDMIGGTTKLTWRLDVDAALARGRPFCIGMIRGLFDSDGSIACPRPGSVGIRYGSTNECGARALYGLMQRLGFDVGLGKPTKKGEYRISVRAASADQYAREVSSGIDYKRQKLEAYLAARTSTAGRGAANPDDAQ